MFKKKKKNQTDAGKANTVLATRKICTPVSRKT